ncbi:signal peptide peptidase SppA [Indiicoccus explosivorum]|uniref:signal peptide peptidase SppA n=1 Tax=Indiicoccus explosivorum TaxID=1917864 RepID=UPI000B42E79C|nr:signal peptide peptidase SppA [Indiicoccus explosivorum]
MNTKRWIALAAAAALLVISTGVNAALALFTTDFTAEMDNLFAAAEPAYMETVIEEGSLTERIAVVRVDGVIQDTGEAPMFGMAGYNHQVFMDQLEQIKQDGTVKAVLLAVDSPGGGVVESAEIHDQLLEIKEETDMPIYVSMGAMAASGGYYISAPADKIFASNETLTGSLGVIMESVNYAELAERYGVDFVTFKSGPHKDIMSPTREMTAEEKAIMQSMLDESYETFVDVIAEGRGMSEKEVKTLADGRIMSGRQALEAGLIDAIGFEEDALSALQTDLGLEKAEVFEYGTEQGFGSLFALKVQSLFGGSPETQLLSRLFSEYSSPRMMYLYGTK